MDISRIANCNMSSCSYNMNNQCHTPAISVGPHAMCNTFYMAKSRGGFNDTMGGIGACVASNCKFNDRLECKASNVNIGAHDAHADCQTFGART